MLNMTPFTGPSRRKEKQKTGVNCILWSFTGSNDYQNPIALRYLLNVANWKITMFIRTVVLINKSSINGQRLAYNQRVDPF